MTLGPKMFVGMKIPNTEYITFQWLSDFRLLNILYSRVSVTEPIKTMHLILNNMFTLNEHEELKYTCLISTVYRIKFTVNVRLFMNSLYCKMMFMKKSSYFYWRCLFRNCYFQNWAFQLEFFAYLHIFWIFERYIEGASSFYSWVIVWENNWTKLIVEISI